MRSKTPRMGRNPKIEEPVSIRAHWVLSFRSSAKLRERIGDTLFGIGNEILNFEEKAFDA